MSVLPSPGNVSLGIQRSRLLICSTSQVRLKGQPVTLPPACLAHPLGNLVFSFDFFISKFAFVQLLLPGAQLWEHSHEQRSFIL